MEFSPIVVQRKSTAPASGSSNPFDDFDFLHISQPLSPGKQAPPLTAGSPRIERFDSEDDPFNLFSDEAASPQKSSAVKRPSGLRNVVKAEEDPEESDGEGSEESSVSADRPPVPPRGPIPNEWVQRIREPVIPFGKDDAELYQFLSSPLEEGAYLRMIITIDPVAKIYKLIQASTHRIVLTAHKRTDGLKALSLAANYSIMMLPTDHAFTVEPSANRAGSVTVPVRIAKLRGNTLGSQYSLFDQGKSPTKAVGVLEVRRELLGVRFDLLPSIYTRRATQCFLPVPGQLRRPTSKDEMLAERAKKNDPGVLHLSPLIPNLPRLPRLEDFQGFAAIHSVKNVMLHLPSTKQVVFRLGKQDKTMFHLEFTRPFSVVTAFALAISSCDSKVHPNRQL